VKGEGEGEEGEGKEKEGTLSPLKFKSGYALDAACAYAENEAVYDVI